MSAFRFFCVAALSLALAAPAFGESASRMLLSSRPDPAKLGQTVKLVGEVDGLGDGAPKGTVDFTDGDVALGAGTLSPYGAGQATLVAGDRHSCALTSAGGVRCWGGNTVGQLGAGFLGNSRVPVDVFGFTSGVVAIASSTSEHSCALTTEGRVKCWGYNQVGQIGDGTRTNRRAPVGVRGLGPGNVAITTGGYQYDARSCALTGGGAVWCWGALSNEQKSTTPVAIAGLKSGVVAIADTCAVTQSGAAKCWGGDLIPVVVPGLSSGVVAITAGRRHKCALTNAGSVKCWGGNYYGQLGDGTNVDRPEPVAVSGLSSGVVAIAAGGSHTCALKGGGALLCWGWNYAGQIGDRTRTNRYTPVSVPGHTRGVAAIAAGGAHTCVTTDAGIVRCWGSNSYGQLGDGTGLSRGAPKPVLDMTPLVRARASLLTRALGVGAHTLRATYSGDALHSPSSGTRAQTIIP